MFKGVKADFSLFYILGDGPCDATRIENLNKTTIIRK